MSKKEQLALYERLEPRTEFSGGRITPTDVLTLDEAARMASRHVGEDVTPADFLRAAARGEIQLHAVVHRSARFRCSHSSDEPPLNGGQPVPARAPLPLSRFACSQLAIGGRALWRTIESMKRDSKLRAAWWYYDAWELEPDEPDLETVPDDCRVTGYDTHALADAFLLDHEEEINPTSERTASALDGKPETEPQSESDVEAAGDEWKAIAQAEAWKYIKEQRRQDLYPNQLDIANKVAEILRARGIGGTTGKAMSGESIKRHALKGITSGTTKRSK